METLHGESTQYGAYLGDKTAKNVKIANGQETPLSTKTFDNGDLSLAKSHDVGRSSVPERKAITFHGAVEGMEEPVDPLVAEVKQRIDVFAPGGGFVLASCNHMVDVPPENILAMFATAREYKLQP